MPGNDKSDLQTRVAEIALRVAGAHGFVLAGGKALQVHGLSSRPTEDVDLFTNIFDIENFSLARQGIVEELREAGFSVETVRDVPGFARLSISDLRHSHNEVVEMDLGIDWRSDAEGIPLNVGAVLAQNDAVASKTIALFNRAYPRDFIDLFNIVSTGKYTVSDLLALAHERDPGFNVDAFKEALGVIAHLNYEEVTGYGVTQQQWETIRHWTLQLSSALADNGRPTT